MADRKPVFMKVPIRQRHIDAATPKCPTNCIMVRGLRDACPDGHYFNVTVNGATVTLRKPFGKSERQHWIIPTCVAKRIIAYDETGEATPFVARLRLGDTETITPPTKKRQAQASAARDRFNAKLVRKGLPKPVYGKRKRELGLSVAA